MHLNLVEIWNEMGWPVRSVVIVLTIEAVATITVAIDRGLFLWSTRRKDRAFGRAASEDIEQGRLRAAMITSARLGASPLARLVNATLCAYDANLSAGASLGESMQQAERAGDRETELFSEELGRGLNVIASTGSTAPFVGLLGTVLGIIAAFRLISASGSGGIGTIGSAIGEALVVTGYGLVVAIPAVLLFNAISTRVDRYEARLRRQLEELRDRIAVERWEVQPVQTSRASKESGPVRRKAA